GAKSPADDSAAEERDQRRDGSRDRYLRRSSGGKRQEDDVARHVRREDVAECEEADGINGPADCRQCEESNPQTIGAHRSAGRPCNHAATRLAPEVRLGQIDDFVVPAAEPGPPLLPRLPGARALRPCLVLPPRPSPAVAPPFGLAPDALQRSAHVILAQLARSFRDRETGGRLQDRAVADHATLGVLSRPALERCAPSRFRRKSRARCTRILTAAAVRPRVSAISRCESPSTSRKSSTTR